MCIVKKSILDQSYMLKHIYWRVNSKFFLFWPSSLISVCDRPKSWCLCPSPVSVAVSASALSCHPVPAALRPLTIPQEESSNGAYAFCRLRSFKEGLPTSGPKSLLPKSWRWNLLCSPITQPCKPISSPTSYLTLSAVSPLGNNG